VLLGAFLSAAVSRTLFPTARNSTTRRRNSAARWRRCRFWLSTKAAASSAVPRTRRKAGSTPSSRHARPLCDDTFSHRVPEDVLHVLPAGRLKTRGPIPAARSVRVLREVPLLKHGGDGAVEVGELIGGPQAKPVEDEGPELFVADLCVCHCSVPRGVCLSSGFTTAGTAATTSRCTRRPGIAFDLSRPSRAGLPGGSGLRAVDGESGRPRAGIPAALAIRSASDTSPAGDSP
jgi:hypothetical protein